MTGPSHAATGTASGVASLPPPLAAADPLAAIVWIALATIGALLPDLDEPQSTLGRRSLGLAHLIRALAGGHREGTHDIITAPLTWLILGTLTGITSGVAAHAGPLGWWWAGAPLAVGVAVGILGDSITVDGVPIPGTWMLPGRAPRWGLRLFRTGNTLAETLVVGLSWAAAITIAAHTQGALTW